MEVINKKKFSLEGFSSTESLGTTEVSKRIEALKEKTKKLVIYKVNQKDQFFYGVETLGEVDYSSAEHDWMCFRIGGKISDNVVPNAYKLVDRFLGNNALYTFHVQGEIIEEIRFYDVENDLCEVILYIPIQQIN